MKNDKPTSRKQRAAETKNRIYQTAADLIQRNGFENVQIEDICREANISMGLFYNYFSSKADILSSTFEYVTAEKYEEIFQKHLQGLTGLRMLRAFFVRSLELHCLEYNKKELQNHYANLLTHRFRGSEVTDQSRNNYVIFSTALNEAKETGELPSTLDVASTAKKLSMLLRGIIFEYLISDVQKETFDYEEIIRLVLDPYLLGLAHSLPEASSS